MILIISKYPTAANEKDGMIQRIAAIDNIIDAQQKIYLDISYKKNLITKKTRTSTNTSVYETNIVFGLFIASYFAITANKIYVHSILNAIKILPLYFFSKKILTDLHGIVPEELHMQGRIYSSKIFSIVEHIVFYRSLKLITVTNAMKEYLVKKYNQRINISTVPIFDSISNIQKINITSNKLTIIYTGGSQKWQNVDLMFSAIKQTSNKYNYILLSGDIDTFNKKAYEHGLDNTITIASVGKDEIYSWYSKADLGFVLRDDIAVNNVACPTKLIEYLINGVVPIVIHPNIGDFNSMGYCYITLDEFLNSQFSESEIAAKRMKNYEIVTEYQRSISNGISELEIFINR